MQIRIIEHETGPEAWRYPISSSKHSAQKVDQRQHLQEVIAAQVVQRASALGHFW
jgi:hypothetical protein